MNIRQKLLFSILLASILPIITAFWLTLNVKEQEMKENIITNVRQNFFFVRRNGKRTEACGEETDDGGDQKSRVNYSSCHDVH